jgi:hypothetical protein
MQISISSPITNRDIRTMLDISDNAELDEIKKLMDL